VTTLSAGHALWQQRHRLADRAERARRLSGAVGSQTDLSPAQWMQLLAFTLEFQPDLIVELGRERGNSTCCFLEAAELLQPDRACRLLSLCLTDYWQRETRPRLEQSCSREWFERGRMLVGNLLEYDFSGDLRQSRRTLIFWDAHGFDVAEHVLGRILPLVAGRPVAVLLHDMSDLRYDGQPIREYGPDGLWKGSRDSQGTFWLGHIASHVAQAVSVVDFTTRNTIPLHSAGEDLHQEFAAWPDKVMQMRLLLGADLFSMSAHWFWFCPGEASAPLVYPPCCNPAPATPAIVKMARTARRLGSGLKRVLLPQRKEAG
jgi:hypothetical protein